LNAAPRRSAPLAAAATIPASAETLKEVEWLHIQRVLDEEKGSVGRASKRLGIPRSSLYQKLKLRDAGPNSAA
jgi:ActR/RegA family two-component response regulator